ncbi:MAG TPA: histidine triad nucleotide-binding protein [Bacillota bacterium]|nr:histidine triad nucleotide-binding protein [Bacillota bacterium]
MDCVFCRIVNGDIPSRRVFEDGDIVAFHDVAPQAPTHVLVIPRRHVTSLAELDDPALAGRLLHVAAEVAKSLGLQGGYRVVVNTGPDGGQTVDHLHLHVLGGRSLTWPPG